MGDDIILLGHGSGGKLSHRLLEDTILRILSTGSHAAGNDAALVTVPGGRAAFTTDCFVVEPLFFPGGNIGDLAVNGTVNDLAVMGGAAICSGGDAGASAGGGCGCYW